MKRPPIPAPSPAFLPLGAVVGPWRVVAWAGQGVYGAVYRAVRVGQEDGEPVALKVALLPRDPVRPEERGSAQELAEALERATKPLRAERSEERADTRDGAASSLRRAHSGRLGLAMAAAGLALAVGLWWSAPGHPREEPSGRAAAAVTEQPDAGTVGLGDSVAPASTEDAAKLPASEVMAEDTLPEPQPGQLRPDAKGRCPYKQQVALNGGCWGASLLRSEDCETLGGQMFKGTCYQPLPAPKRRPTSSPVDKP